MRPSKWDPQNEILSSFFMWGFPGGKLRRWGKAEKRLRSWGRPSPQSGKWDPQNETLKMRSFPHFSCEDFQVENWGGEERPKNDWGVEVGQVLSLENETLKMRPLKMRFPHFSCEDFQEENWGGENRSVLTLPSEEILWGKWEYFLTFPQFSSVLLTVSRELNYL